MAKICKFFYSVRLTGISPPILLSESSNLSKLANFANDLGNLPVMLLSDIDNTFKLDMLPITSGNSPEILLLKRSKCSRLLKPPISFGMEPDSSGCNPHPRLGTRQGSRSQGSGDRVPFCIWLRRRRSLVWISEEFSFFV